MNRVILSGNVLVKSCLTFYMTILIFRILRHHGAIRLESQKHKDILEQFKIKMSTEDLWSFEANPQLLQFKEMHTECYDCRMKVQGYITKNQNRCSNMEHIKVLFVINSGIDNFIKRRSIRTTWAQRHLVELNDMQYIFVIGNRNEARTMAVIQNEAGLYGDLIVGEFNDTYEKLGMKTIFGLQWAVDYCQQASVVIKTDDDLMYDVYNLPKAIRQVVNDDKTLHGNCLVSGVPHRNPLSKWYASFRLYPHQFYGPFCLGAAFMMHINTAKLIVRASRQVSYFPVEDVFVSAICGSHVGIKTKHFPGLSVTDVKLDFCNKTDGIYSTLISKPYFFAKLWPASQKSLEFCNNM